MRRSAPRYDSTRRAHGISRRGRLSFCPPHFRRVCSGGNRMYTYKVVFELHGEHREMRVRATSPAAARLKVEAEHPEAIVTAILPVSDRR